MLIETELRQLLAAKTGLQTLMEVPPGGAELPYLVLEKTGGAEENYIRRSTFALQAYGESLLQAAENCEAARTAMFDAAELPTVATVRFGGEYNFSDTAKRIYRYQAVFDVYHY